MTRLPARPSGRSVADGTATAAGQGSGDGPAPAQLQWEGKELRSMTVKDLKSALSSLGMRVGGLKGELQSRLAVFLTAGERPAQAQTEAPAADPALPAGLVSKATAAKQIAAARRKAKAPRKAKQDQDEQTADADSLATNEAEADAPVAQAGQPSDGAAGGKPAMAGEPDRDKPPALVQRGHDGVIRFRGELVSGMKVSELKEALKEVGLPVKGLKKDLRERLEAAATDASERGSESEDESESSAASATAGHEAPAAVGDDLLSAEADLPNPIDSEAQPTSGVQGPDRDADDQASSDAGVDAGSPDAASAASANRGGEDVGDDADAVSESMHEGNSHKDQESPLQEQSDDDAEDVQSGPASIEAGPAGFSPEKPDTTASTAPGSEKRAQSSSVPSSSHIPITPGALSSNSPRKAKSSDRRTGPRSSNTHKLSQKRRREEQRIASAAVKAAGAAPSSPAQDAQSKKRKATKQKRPSVQAQGGNEDQVEAEEQARVELAARAAARKDATGKKSRRRTGPKSAKKRLRARARAHGDASGAASPVPLVGVDSAKLRSVGSRSRHGRKSNVQAELEEELLSEAEDHPEEDRVVDDEAQESVADDQVSGDGALADVEDLAASGALENDADGSSSSMESDDASQLRLDTTAFRAQLLNKRSEELRAALEKLKLTQQGVKAARADRLAEFFCKPNLDFKVGELKIALSLLGLPVNGTKAVLAERFRSALGSTPVSRGVKPEENGNLPSKSPPSPAASEMRATVPEYVGPIPIKSTADVRGYDAGPESENEIPPTDVEMEVDADGQVSEGERDSVDGGDEMEVGEQQAAAAVPESPAHQEDESAKSLRASGSHSSPRTSEHVADIQSPAADGLESQALSDERSTDQMGLELVDEVVTTSAVTVQGSDGSLVTGFVSSTLLSRGARHAPQLPDSGAPGTTAASAAASAGTSAAAAAAGAATAATTGTASDAAAALDSPSANSAETLSVEDGGQHVVQEPMTPPRSPSPKPGPQVDLEQLMAEIGQKGVTAEDFERYDELLREMANIKDENDEVRKSVRKKIRTAKKKARTPAKTPGGDATAKKKKKKRKSKAGLKSTAKKSKKQRTNENAPFPLEDDSATNGVAHSESSRAPLFHYADQILGTPATPKDHTAQAHRPRSSIAPPRWRESLAATDEVDREEPALAVSSAAAAQSPFPAHRFASSALSQGRFENRGSLSAYRTKPAATSRFAPRAATPGRTMGGGFGGRRPVFERPALQPFGTPLRTAANSPAFSKPFPTSAARVGKLLRDAMNEESRTRLNELEQARMTSNRFAASTTPARTPGFGAGEGFDAGKTRRPSAAQVLSVSRKPLQGTSSSSNAMDFESSNESLRKGSETNPFKLAPAHAPRDVAPTAADRTPAFGHSSSTFAASTPVPFSGFASTPKGPAPNPSSGSLGQGNAAVLQRSAPLTEPKFVFSPASAVAGPAPVSAGDLRDEELEPLEAQFQF